ncbi:MAG: hypothetical protein AAGN46_11885 [Acidobacteriota bacterium]
MSSIQQTSVAGARRLLAAAGCAALLAIGCAGGDEPTTTPTSVTTTQAPPSLEPPPPLPPPIREVPVANRAKVKVIDPGGPESDQPQTLIEASRLAKSRKQTERTEPVIAEINDENLGEFVEGTEIMVVEGEPAVPNPGSEPSSDPSADTSADAAETSLEPTSARSDIRDESYWRDRALELRMGWRRSVDEIADLELESAALRQRFYGEDDPFVRDSEIKPTWDRVLDRLETLRTRSRRYERELEQFLEEGRRAGAMQGWLNQGWELEPTDEELRMVEGLSIAESSEPTTRDPVQ